MTSTNRPEPLLPPSELRLVLALALKALLDQIAQVLESAVNREEASLAG